MRERPNGVTYLAIAAVIGGVFSFAAAIILMLGGGVGAAAGASTGGTVMVLGAVTFALSLVSLGLGYGFWTMKAWAWPAAFVVYGVTVAVNVASVVLAGASVLSIIAPVAISAVIFWYLLQPQIKTAFGR